MHIWTQKVRTYPDGARPEVPHGLKGLGPNVGQQLPHHLAPGGEHLHGVGEKLRQPRRQYQHGAQQSGTVAELRGERHGEWESNNGAFIYFCQGVFSFYIPLLSFIYM